MTIRRSATKVALGLVLLASRAFADDLADEAELHFARGTAAYQAKSYELSLEHFLLSNRLVPNKNVTYNIARCFEQLGKYPEAFRYYEQALAVGSWQTSDLAIEQALTRIASKVAVVSIASEPKSATLYLSRKDLGAIGTTPRRLGLAPGSYTIIAELPGYHPKTIEIGTIAAGETRRMEIALSPILGKIRVDAEPGSRARLGRTHHGSSCLSPCEMDVPPGRYEVVLSRPMHQEKVLVVEVHEERTTVVTARLERLTGTVVVTTDEPNALVEIDGVPRGFTPTVVDVPVGKHRVSVRLRGYENQERTVLVEPRRRVELAIELVQNEQVEGASRRLESVNDTASSVSLVSKEELRALAYPTVAEALRGLPGVYFSDDRSYVGIGMRGLGRLNSYGNRVLVLLDGVAMNDNWIGSASVGHDLMTDLGDVERIELIRGPGSAVYGTGAFSGVINVVTRQALDDSLEVSASTSVDGVARARARGNTTWGKDGRLFLSASVGHSDGRDYYFPQYRNMPVRHVGDEPGWSRGLDGMRTVTTQGLFQRGVVSAHWFFHQYRKELPSAPFDTWFGDPRTTQTDARGFLELCATPRLSTTTTTLSRLVMNQYQFLGRYARPYEKNANHEVISPGLEEDAFRGHWLNFEQRLMHRVSKNWLVAVGGEGAYHFDVQQTARDAEGYFLNQRGNAQRRYGVVALYGTVDGHISDRWSLSLGGRVDHYSTFGTSINPRLGMVARPYTAGVTKMTVGRAFRAPSIYELYYNDNGRTQVASPTLSPETMLSAEVEHTHRFASTVVATATVYASTVRGLIDSTGAGTVEEPIHYISSQNPLAAVGAEFGLRREFRAGYMAALYLSCVESRMLRNGTVDSWIAMKAEPGFRNITNVPSYAAAFKGAIPFLLRGVSLGTRMAIEDGRWDRFELAGESAQRKTPVSVLWDAVVTAADERQRIRTSLGVYNIFDMRQKSPVSSEFRPLRTMSGVGRSLLLSLEVRR